MDIFVLFLPMCNFF